VNASSSSTDGAAVNTPNPTTSGLDDPVDEGVVSSPTVQSNSVTPHTEVTVPLSLSQTHDLPIKSGTPVDSQTEMSRSLDHAQQVVDAVKTWESAVGVIK
jgi:hypothetical protein